MNAGGAWTEADPELVERKEPPAASGVRPYLLTGGRTGPVKGTLEIEAQMATTPLGRAILERLSFEQHDIVKLCQQPTAVAEIAAQLNLHLGVARVIVGDLLTSGYLSARRPEVGLHRNVPIIERVIRGLQAIR
ncbi:MAG: DUF742 domain-containing protein [Dactylosporangium sp.]|nr:DUF742 domain-containing protein [Dactylosporangium sp.]